MTPDDTGHTASDTTIRDADGHAWRLRWARRAPQLRQPSLSSLKAWLNRRSLRRRAGGDQGTQLARLTARQLRNAPGASASWPRFLVAHASWILIVTFAAVAAAGALAHSQQPSYKSTAVVSVQPAPVAAGSGNPPNMATEEGIATSGTVLARASAALGVPRTALAKGVSVSVPGTTTLLQITYVDPVPRVAQQRAQAIAEAYVSYRSSRSATTRRTGPATLGMTPTAVLVTPAPMPTAPAGPKYLIIVGAALIVGLALAIGTAALRDYMDDGLRGPLDLELQADAPVLALIPAFRPRRRDPGGRLVAVAYPHSLVAEAYRGLRTRLVEVATTSGHAKTLLVTSPGWEGKSTVAANLAAALAQSGRSVVLVSADMRWSRVHELFGLGIGPGLSVLLEGRTSLAEALQPTQVPGLWLLPPGMPPPDPAALLQSPAWHIALSDISRRADIAVIEAPPMLASPDARALAERAEMILVVADARRSTRAQVRLAMREVEQVRGKLAGCVLDNVGRRRWLGSRGPEPLADGRALAAGRERDLAPMPGQPSVEQLEKVFADLARAIADRGETHAAMGRHEEALADFTRAIELNPHLAGGNGSRGQAEVNGGREQAGGNGSQEQAGANGSRGQADGGTGRSDDAATDYTQVIDIDPDDARAMGSRGQAGQAAARHEEALADYARAIGLDPNLARAIAGRGETNAAMGRYDEALADFTRAIELDPRDSWAIGSRGQAYQAMARHEEALADYARAIGLDPNLAWAIAGRGETNAAMGRYDEALADFTRAIELDPRDSWAIASRAQAYGAMGRHEEALADFSRAIGLDPNLAWVNAGRGETYRLMGRYDEALADFTRAVNLDPGYAWAIASRAQAYGAMGRHEDALADFSQAIDLDPSLAWAIAGRGEAYAAMGRHEEALADLSQAIELNPELAWAISRRAQVYEELGRHDEARADRSRATDADQDPLVDAGGDAPQPAEPLDPHQEAERRPDEELTPSAIDAVDQA